MKRFYLSLLLLIAAVASLSGRFASASAENTSEAFRFFAENAPFCGKKARAVIGAGCCDHFRCQILSLYSRMVRSEEKTPEQAVLVMAIFSHFSRFG